MTFDSDQLSERPAEVENSVVLPPHRGSTGLSIACSVNAGSRKDERLTLPWVGCVSVWREGSKEY